MTDSPNRTHTITWDDPMISANAVRHMKGIDHLRAIINGEIPPPPIAQLLDMQLLEVEEGRATFRISASEYFYNPIGLVHGGIACTILDSAMGCAVQSSLPGGLAYTTVELNVHLVRGITIKTGELRAVGEAVHVGRQMATAQSRLIDLEGKLYAHATTTCFVFPIETPSA
jgi:uncharacterized protein (TIGR00369 family)